MKIEYVMLDENLRFDDVRAYLTVLPQERREKIDRYRFEKDKLLSFAAGLLIRRATGDSGIVTGEHGKPHAENGVHFSVSHSGRIAAVAVDDAPVGLDVEQLPDKDRLKIADRFYHPKERDYVAESDDRGCAFCEIWTRKEAYLKMTGEGISADLTAFDTTSPPLKEQLYTTSVGEYCFSVCSSEPIGEKTTEISFLELKELL